MVSIMVAKINETFEAAAISVTRMIFPDTIQNVAANISINLFGDILHQSVWRKIQNT